MQAVILVGGEGTRLRPLTSTVPKPVVPLVDRPFIAFMLEWLKGHGIDDVIMSCGFLAWCSFVSTSLRGERVVLLLLLFSPAIRWYADCNDLNFGVFIYLTDV